MSVRIYERPRSAPTGHWMLPRRGVAPRKAHFVEIGAEPAGTDATTADSPIWLSVDGVECVAASAALRASYPECLECAEHAKAARVCC